MAAKAVLTSLGSTNIDNTQAQFIATGTITLTGNYVTHGDTLDLSGLSIPSGNLPTRVVIFELTPAPGPAYGGIYTYVPGTTQANGLLQMNISAGTESGATAYSGFATGFALGFQAWFPSL